MHSYFDVKAIAQEDIPTHAVLSAVFSQLHFVLAERALGDVAICFPHADKGLGDTLRLQGPESALQQIACNARWQRLADYFRLGAIAALPRECAWVRVARKQPKLSAAKLRRMVARGRISAEEAEARLAGPSELSEPFVHVQSISSGQKFRLFISQQPAEKPQCAQVFNAYGLGGVVAWF